MVDEPSPLESAACKYLEANQAAAVSSIGDIKKGHIIGIAQRNDFYAFIADKDGDNAQQRVQFSPKMIYYGSVSMHWLLWWRPYISRESREHIHGADPRCIVEKENAHNVYLIRGSLETRIKAVFQKKQKPTFVDMKR